MPYTKMIVHLVWSTKKRLPLLRYDLRAVFLDHVRANAADKGIKIDLINCHLDHVHALISLEADQNLSKVISLLKGESSHWINQQKLILGKFAWQEDYFAVSVSESGLDRVRDYIRNQDKHHKKKSFQDEYEEFLRIYGFKKVG